VCAVSDIHFFASPRIIDINLTDTMSMDCTLNNSGNTVSHLVSIVITRLDANSKEQLVASVSTFDPAHALTDQSTMQVAGTVTESTVSNNYLHLSWDHPAEPQASKYTCEINAIDMNARPVMFSAAFVVSSRVATTEDIVHHVRVLEEHDAVQKMAIHSLSQQVGLLASRVTALEAQLKGVTPTPPGVTVTAPIVG